MPKLRLSPILLVMNIALVVYGLTALMSLVTAYDSTLSEATIAAVVVSIIVYFIVVNRLRRLETTPLFAKGIVVAGLIFSLFFISQFSHQNYPETPNIINTLGRLTTFLPNLDVFIHQNSASTFLELLLPIAMTLFLVSTDMKRKVFWAFSLLVLAYAFLLTYSRGAYLGLAVAILLGAAVIGAKRLSGRQATALVAGIISLIILFVLGMIVLGPRVPFVASLAGVTSSRLEIYRNSLTLAGDYLFTGIGVGDTFAMVYARYSLMIFVPLFTYTHNLFLAVLVGQGIIGLAAFIIVIITFYLFVVRVLWVVRLAVIEPLFYGALVGVTAALVHGLTDARQYVESPFNLPLLFAGMALTVACGINALRAEAFEDRTTNQGRGWGTLKLVTAGAAVVLVAGFVIFNRQVLAAWHTNLGALAETRGDEFIQPNIGKENRDAYIKIARDEYQQALALDPDFPNLNRRLGNLNVGGEAFKEAVPLLEKAYTAEPDYIASIKGLGLAYTWNGETDKAACVFKQLPDVKAIDEELYTWQNFRHEQQQDLLSAYALETAAILEDYQQTNMDVWALIGERYKTVGKMEMAQQWYSRALAKDKNNTAAVDGLNALELTRVQADTAVACS
jgi:tetratricopeptide (TPR) repeat protein/O-antigen ligase